MPNISRGARMGGLMVYLAGPGRSNEHAEPHLVAGDPAVLAWHEDAELDRASALEIARALDRPRRAFGTRVTVAVKDKDGHRRGVRDAHVWHCSLSLRCDERPLSDEQWAPIAEQFVGRMGFCDEPACRWVAVRHGPSRAGNDHVHVVVSLVREDGTRASVWNDRPRAQEAVGELERRHGLEVLESRGAGHGARGHKPAERATAERRGGDELARERLARSIRGCAAAAQDEAEFVRRVRRAGVRLRPRYAAGRDDVVAGYSAALRPPPGQALVWYGGGHLARDLTLPRLRADWPDTPDTSRAAVAEWRAARRNRRMISPGRERVEPDPQLWERYTADVAALRERLRSVPAEDRATWAHVARETSGAFAAWSLRVEPTPGPLAATAAQLARSAQLRAHRVRARPAGLPSARGAALLLASATHGGRGAVAQAVLLRQLANTAKALHDAHQAAGYARAAHELATVVRGQLGSVSRALPPGADPAAGPAGERDAAEAARAATQPQPRPARSPVPAPLPERPATGARPARTGRDRTRASDVN